MLFAVTEVDPISPSCCERCAAARSSPYVARTIRKSYHLGQSTAGLTEFAVIFSVLMGGSHDAVTKSGLQSQGSSWGCSSM